MSNMILLFNHKLTDEQVDDARKNWGITEFIYPPDSVRKIWEMISPYDDVPHHLYEVTEWLSLTAVEDDYVLVQGESGAVFYLVDYCFYQRLRPVYATTERRYVEKVLDKGIIERKHIFKHVRYRSYRRYDE